MHEYAHDIVARMILSVIGNCVECMGWTEQKYGMNTNPTEFWNQTRLKRFWTSMYSVNM